MLGRKASRMCLLKIEMSQEHIKPCTIKHPNRKKHGSRFSILASFPETIFGAVVYRNFNIFRITFEEATTNLFKLV